MNNFKQQIRKTLNTKLPRKLIFPELCITPEQRQNYANAHQSPDFLERALPFPKGSPYSRSIHMCQFKFIFRELYFHAYPIDSKVRNYQLPITDIIRRLAHGKLNRKKHDSMRLSTIPNHMGSTLINQFYNGHYYAWWPEVARANNYIDRDILTDLLLGAIGPPRIKPEWKNSTVIGILSGIRQQENFELMPIVADALQDAGCDDEHLINRLRESSHFSLGDWLFKTTGMIG